MTNICKTARIFIAGLFFVISAQGQSLTITNAGETGTSGTNWSITGNTLTVTGVASIQQSVITNFLTNTGSLSVVGNSGTLSLTISQAISAGGSNSLTFGANGSSGSITVSQSVTVGGALSFNGTDINLNAGISTTSSGSAILCKATGNNVVNGIIVSTNGGNIILWSDADASGTGGVLVNDNSQIDSRTSADRGSGTHTSGGGMIIMAGGADDGGTASGISTLCSGLTSGDGIPDGYAVNCGSSFAQTGVVLGTSTSASGHNSNVKIYTGSGALKIFAKSTNASGTAGIAAGPTAFQAYQGFSLNAGSSGDITIIGNAALTTGTWAIGMDLAAWRSDSYSASSTIQTQNGNINIIGRASGGSSGNLGMAIDGTTSNRDVIAVTGTGNIVIDGLATGLSPTDVRFTGTDLLAGAGNIQIVCDGTSGLAIANFVGDGLFLGKKAAGLVTSTTANVILKTNALTFQNPLTVNTTGQFSLEPFGSSFNAAISWPIANLVVSNISGLTIGKSTNTANVTIASATAVNGPVTVYGGTVTINGNLSSSTGGNISLFANTLNFGAGKTLSSTGELLVAPQSAAVTVGVAGATGSLSLPASYFSANFSNGFALINVGSDNQTGLITLGSFTAQDPVAVKSSNISISAMISLGDNDLVIDPRITSIGGISASNFFNTNGTGRLRRNIDVGSSFTFPAGRSALNAVTITNNTAASDIFSVNVLDEVYSAYNGTTGAATGSTIAGPRIMRTWNISKTTGDASTGSGVDFIFNWNAGEETSSPAISIPALYHFAGGIWTSQTGTTSTGVRSLTYTGYNGSFSPFAIGDANIALPVTWLSFTATKVTDGVLLKWSTASEMNSRDFIIEYSNNGVQWYALGSVTAGGTSNSNQTYSFIHNSPLKGSANNFYRIRQRNQDGTASVSKVISIEYNEAGRTLAVYPNPASKLIHVFVTEPQWLQLISESGKLVWRGWVTAGTNTIQLEHLSKGIYLLHAASGTSKLVIQ